MSINNRGEIGHMVWGIVINAIISTGIILGVSLLLGTGLECILNTIRRLTIRVGGLVWIEYLTIIGVIHHELSHTIIAFITGAKIKNVSLYKIDHSNGNLGGVLFVPRGNKVIQSIQIVLTSIAPVCIGFITLWIMFTRVNPGLDGLALCIAGYMEFSILCHMSLSEQDINNIKSELPVLIVILFLISIIFKLDMPSVIAEQAERVIGTVW